MNMSVSENGRPGSSSEGCPIQPMGKKGLSSLSEKVGCRCAKLDWILEPTAIVVTKVASSRRIWTHKRRRGGRMIQTSCGCSDSMAVGNGEAGSDIQSQ